MATDTTDGDDLDGHPEPTDAEKWVVGDEPQLWHRDSECEALRGAEVRPATEADLRRSIRRCTYCNLSAYTLLTSLDPDDI